MLLFSLETSQKVPIVTTEARFVELMFPPSVLIVFFFLFFFFCVTCFGFATFIRDSALNEVFLLMI